MKERSNDDIFHSYNISSQNQKGGKVDVDDYLKHNSAPAVDLSLFVQI